MGPGRTPPEARAAAPPLPGARRHAHRRDLLTTWENWSARDSPLRILAGAITEEQRAILRPALDDMPELDPLDALRESTELVALLTGWQWQAV